LIDRLEPVNLEYFEIIYILIINIKII
jgi:hypothetical protein